MEDAQPQAPSQSREAGAPSATPQQQPVAWPPDAARIKAWGDAATAVLKALLLTLAILVVGIVAGTTVWRDQHSRVVTIAVDPEAEKTLRSLGSDLDLRKALVDALNERVRGVQQIVEFGFAKLIDANQPDAVSFKPFGLDLSTGDIAHMFRDLLGSPPPEAVHVELMCVPLLCNAPGAIRGSLLVTLSGPRGSRRVSYPIPLANPGLRRGLHQAMQRSANLLLEKAEPIIASIYDLNAPLQMVFRDNQRQGLERAEGEALTARGTRRDTCVADLVIGVSLFRRELLADGIAAERRAAGESDLTCQVHAETNIAFLLVPYALCSPSPASRKEAYDLARQALDRLPKLDRSMVGDLVFERIPTARLNLDIVQAIAEAGGEMGKKAISNGARTAPSGVSNSALNARIRVIIEDMRKQLPPNPSLQYGHHGVIDWLRLALEAGVPREDLPGRFMTARMMMRAIDAYTLTDKHPRRLFVEQGELAMDAAWAAHDALALPHAEKLSTLKATGLDPATAEADPNAMLQDEISNDLAAARVAFENAIVTDTVAPLIELSSDIEPLTLLGDALFATGDISAAQDAYARAVDAFIEDDEPLDQIVLLARAAAHWASLRVAGGACQPNAPPDGAWEKRWRLLGAGAHDVCALGQPEGQADRPALFGIIRPLVADAIKNCAQSALAPEAGVPRGWHPEQDERLAMSDCLRSSGPNDLSILRPFVDGQAGATVEAEIENALNARP